MLHDLPASDTCNYLIVIIFFNGWLFICSGFTFQKCFPPKFFADEHLKLCSSTFCRKGLLNVAVTTLGRCCWNTKQAVPKKIVSGLSIQSKTCFQKDCLRCNSMSVFNRLILFFSTSVGFLPSVTLINAKELCSKIKQRVLAIYFSLLEVKFLQKFLILENLLEDLMLSY